MKDIRDRMVRPIGGNNGGNNDGNNDDNDNNDDNGDDGDDEHGDEYLLKLDRLLKNLNDDKKFLKTFNENIDDKSKEELEAEELDRMFKKLKNKKILEAEKLERKFEMLKNRKLVKERIDALRKKLNNSADDNNDDNDDNDNNDKFVINLNNMNFNNFLSNPNMTFEIAEELGNYSSKIANKK